MRRIRRLCTLAGLFLCLTFAAALGLNPDSDIFLLGLGEQTNRFAALQAGSADGMVVDPGLSLAAQKKGFHIMYRIGDRLDLIQIALQGKPGAKPVAYEDIVDLTPLKQAHKELGITGSY